MVLRLKTWESSSPPDLKRTQSQHKTTAGWSSPVARQAHNLKVVGSNPTPATRNTKKYQRLQSRANNWGYARVCINAASIPLPDVDTRQQPTTMTNIRRRKRPLRGGFGVQRGGAFHRSGAGLGAGLDSASSPRGRGSVRSAKRSRAPDLLRLLLPLVRGGAAATSGVARALQRLAARRHQARSMRVRLHGDPVTARSASIRPAAKASPAISMQPHSTNS